MTDIAKTTFIFLRHGEPVGGKIFRGSSDDPLTENGWQQMHDSVKDLSYDEIISSPLKRCAEFSEILKNKMQLPLTINENIQEMHLGDWEGLSAAQVEQLDSVALGAFWDAPHSNTPPNGEEFYDFEQRILNAWNTLYKKYSSTQQSKSILVVCHAGVLMVLLKEWLSLPIENILCIKLNYASKVRVEVYDESYNLKPQIYIDHGYEF